MQKKIQRWLVPLAAALVIVFSLGMLVGQGRSSADVPLVRTQRAGAEASATEQVTPAAEQTGEQEGAAAPEEAPPEAAKEAAAPEQTAPTGQIDLNTATAEELQTLPGVGEIIAQRIIDYRDACGGFLTVEQIMEVSGVGEAKFAQMKDLITVEGAP